MTIEIKKDLCIGCGLCATTCQENFMLDKDGKAMVANQEIKEHTKQTAEDCPVGAIKIK